MAVRCSRLFSLSRLIIQSTRPSSSKTNIALEQGSSFFASTKENSTKRPLVTQNDPDVFGTLCPEKLLTVEPLFGNENVPDEGDVEEEKYLSYEPVNRKSIEQYEEEVNNLIKNKQLKEAFKVLEIKMKEERVKPSRNIYSLLLGACGRVGYTKKAFMLFNDMKKRGMLPSESHYTALFNACANSPWPDDGLQRAKKLRQQLVDNNYPLNQLQYHAMIKAFGRHGNVTTAFQILDEMRIKGFIITTETLNFLLQACISLPRDGFKYAIMVWRKLRQAKVTPDVYSYNLMLRATRDCGIGNVKEFEQDCLPLLSAAQNQSLAIASPQEIVPKLAKKRADSSVSIIDYDPKSVAIAERIGEANLPNLLSEHVPASNLICIKHLNRPKDRLALLGGMHGFLREMKKDHAKPDIKTLSLMLETISSTRQEEMLLLEEMEKISVAPDVDLVNMLIKKRQLRRDYSAVKDGLTLLQKHNLCPNIMTFGVLALGCRNIDQCISFCEMMENAGLRMNKEIFGSLLKNAIYHKDCWYVMHLTGYAKKHDLPLDEKALNLLSDFKAKTLEEIAKSDRGQKGEPVYDDPKFRRSFGEFCKTFKLTLKQLTVELDPHPWTQFRYKRDEEDSKQSE